MFQFWSKEVMMWEVTMLTRLWSCEGGSKAKKVWMCQSGLRQRSSVNLHLNQEQRGKRKRQHGRRWRWREAEAEAERWKPWRPSADLKRSCDDDIRRRSARSNQVSGWKLEKNRIGYKIVSNQEVGKEHCFRVWLFSEGMYGGWYNERIRRHFEVRNSVTTSVEFNNKSNSKMCENRDVIVLCCSCQYWWLIVDDRWGR